MVEEPVFGKLDISDTRTRRSTSVSANIDSSSNRNRPPDSQRPLSCPEPKICVYIKRSGEIPTATESKAEAEQEAEQEEEEETGTEKRAKRVSKQGILPPAKIVL